MDTASEKNPRVKASRTKAMDGKIFIELGTQPRAENGARNTNIQTLIPNLFCNQFNKAF